MIGSRTIAHRVALLDGTPDTPSGIAYLGEGCSRVAYLHDNVVYKVGCDRSNTQERTKVNKYLKSKRLHAIGVRVPKASLYTFSHNVQFPCNVLAMEYIPASPGKFRCASTRYCEMHYYNSCDCFANKCDCKQDVCVRVLRRKIGEITGMVDLHNENVLRHDGRWWIIDLGE